MSAKRKPKSLPLPDTPRAGRVRCLGPGKEHSFWSPDRCRYRLCTRCAAAVNATSAIMQHGTDSLRLSERDNV